MEKPKSKPRQKDQSSKTKTEDDKKTSRRKITNADESKKIVNIEGDRDAKYN